jgi:tRNA1(Val) A37 N6-methylase TrmN6
MSNITPEDFTDDTLLGGKIKLRQPRKGYRVSQDAVLLAALTEVQPGQRVLELGTGYGQVALCLAHFYPDIHITAVELLPDVAELARYNVAANNLSHRIEIITANVKGLELGRKFDVAVFNPPYRNPAQHSLSDNRSKNYANFEMEGVLLRDWLASANGHADTLYIVHDAARQQYLVDELGRAATIIPIAAHSHSPARRIIVKAPGYGCTLATLSLQSRTSEWLPDVAAVFAGQETLVKLWRSA